MSATREKKAAVIDKLAEDFKSTETMFLADYRGLDMPKVTELRANLRDADSNFVVVKNTLARMAAEKAGRSDILEMITGPTSVTFVRGDVAAVAKILEKAAKETEVLELRGGIVDGISVGADRVKEIAKLPPREQILAGIVGNIGAPMSQAVGVLNAPLRDIIGMITARIEQLEAAGDS